MGLQGALQKVLGGLKWVPRAIDREIEDSVRDKARAGAEEILLLLDQATPPLADLLAGRKIQVLVTIQLKEASE